MAIFSFKCPDHGVFNKMLPKGLKKYSCTKCGKESERIVSVGTVKVVEKIDNGLMIKPIERAVDIEELMNERNSKYNNRNGGEMI